MSLLGEAPGQAPERGCDEPGSPVHVVPHAPGHGVVLLARQVADAVSAPCLTPIAALRLARQHVHAHVTDQLFGSTPDDAAARLSALGRRHRLTVTLHDVPQATDGHAFARRTRAYARVLAVADGWVVSSHHERLLVERHVQPGAPGVVIPLPVVPSLQPAAPARHPRPGARLTVGVFGWLYPGKGHAEVLAACSRLPGPTTLRVLGGASRGHEPLAAELAAVARRHDVTWEMTGWLAEGSVASAMHAVDVPVAAHRTVSASGSMNSWVAAGRRPLVPRGSYTREMARLRPGTLTLVDPSPEGLAVAIAEAAAAPASTRLADGSSTRPDLVDVASAYRVWWAGS